MVFNREKLFYCFKNIWQKSGKLSGHIFSIYKSFNTWSCSKYWTKPPKTISAHFKDLKYFYRKYFHKNPRKIQQVTNAYCDHLAKPHINQGHFGSPKCPKTLSDQNQIWTTLYYQLSLLDPNFCEHVHMTKWGHYTKWCIKEKWCAQLDLLKSISAHF